MIQKEILYYFYSFEKYQKGIKPLEKKFVFKKGAIPPTIFDHITKMYEQELTPLVIL